MNIQRKSFTIHRTIKVPGTFKFFTISQSCYKSHIVFCNIVYQSYSEALQMSNYNQQYARKFNIKIMNYPENKDEKIRDIFVKDIVKDKLNVKVQLK
jgi:hypothetical protein